jgi:UDP-GlcNAc3NAcA epimerase
MLHVLTVVGARPQFIKAAVLSRLIRSESYRGRLNEFLVHTGQHYDENMSEVFFREMEIPDPDLNLGIGSGGHGRMTGAMLAGLEDLLIERKPDLVLVYGDTNSTLAGALAASKLNIPVAHVEAGLRSFMMSMPEEQNRILTDRLAAYLFCPTRAAVDNLAREGIPEGGTGIPSADDKAVTLAGDIMLDASLYYRERAGQRAAAFLSKMPERFYLLTIHRAENTDDPARLAAIVRAINGRSDKKAVCPLHPRTRKTLERHGLSFGPHVRTIEPVGYFEMLALEGACDFVVTDSGGVQKEAYFFRKPCMTLRESTEWVELVESGWNRLVGADGRRISAAFDTMRTPSNSDQLYGTGNAGTLICDRLLAGR